jgi:2,4-dienoyl-CoA reductase-like NADH-dependent reductase (Old Yellow Enzyme family)
MSLLFKPINIGGVQLANRFIHSATYESMALESGEVTEALIKRYRNLARGEVGLIIPGYLFVHQSGRCYKHQTGIHNDNMVPGLKKLVEAVHQENGKIAFQLVHAGRQTKKALIGQTPFGPSSQVWDPTYLVRPREISTGQIQDVIKAFGEAAGRAVEAGADGIQLHAAHGYLINQFLSPFFNHRKDDWGGSDANRFRFLKEVVIEVRKKVPKTLPILVKLNTNDYTPKEGVTPSLAMVYSKWLADMGINCIEVSCGTISYSSMNMCRGDVPVKELVRSLPAWQKPVGNLVMKSMVGKFDLVEGYNLEAAKMIKSVIGEIPLSVVGGIRKVAHMNEILDNGYADCISMSRPLIREPQLVRKIKEGSVEAVACKSCNRCLAAVINHIPVNCYVKGMP